MKRFTLPPHIAWPAFVIFILGIGVSSASYTFYQANKDGGVARIATETTAQWEARATARSATDAWNGAVRWSSDTPPRLQLTLRDASNDPVSINDGTLTLRQPDHEDPFFETPLTETDAGTYEQVVPMLDDGLWDATVRGTVEDTAVEHTLRFEHDQ
ncbi:MAG: FixH family protein [Longimonas sp.]|uniref:FixH family protein n=1 Tax=Longimonas sp. TaxID=2039626 RepID=UPI0039761EE9